MFHERAESEPELLVRFFFLARIDRYFAYRVEMSEREYTYLSMSNGYMAYDKIIESMFWRVLWKVGVKNPREVVSKEDLESILRGFHDMEMRPGAAECIQNLRDHGFTVWAFTMADYSRINAYFANAGINFPEENMLACDTAQIGKPASAAYKPLMEKLSHDGSKPWFAAAHAWDVSAAKRQG
jgi:2-haloacid dehalogenase